MEWNDTSNQSCITDTEADSRFPVIFAAFGIIIGIFDIIVNSIVLIVFLKSKKLMDNCHYSLVICLAFSDVTLGVSAIIAALRLVNPVWSTHYVLCASQNVMTYVGIVMSFMQTFLISFQRFLLATSTTWHDKIFEGKRRYGIFVITWLIVVGWNTSLLPKEKNFPSVCNIETLYGNNFRLLIASFSVLSIILFLLICTFYLITVNKLRRRYMTTFAWQIENSNRINGVLENSNQAGLRLTEIGRIKVFESLKTVGMIIALLFTLSGPVVGVTFALTLGWQSKSTHKTIFLVCCMALLNSTINPFIYAWKIQELRKECKNTFKKCPSFP